MGMLRLKNPDRFSKEPGPLVKTSEDLPAAQRESLISSFEGHLKVAEVGSSRLIAITFTSRDPVQSAQVANQVVAEYKSYLLNSNFNSSKEVSQWLSAQLGDLSGQVTKTQQTVADFERTHNLSAAMLGLATLGGGSASTSGGGSGGGGGVSIPELGRLTTLNDEVTQAEAARMGREAIYRMTETQNPDLISSIGSGSLAGASGSSVISQFTARAGGDGAGSVCQCGIQVWLQKSPSGGPRQSSEVDSGADAKRDGEDQTEGEERSRPGAAERTGSARRLRSAKARDQQDER
jgi:hypothetical protein